MRLKSCFLLVPAHVAVGESGEQITKHAQTLGFQVHQNYVRNPKVKQMDI